MKQLFIGTSNKNKIKEIKQIFSLNDIEFDIKCPSDFNDDSDPIEDGFSFKENAIIKARHYYNKYHIPCIAEDSGISIDYFNGLPGIHSKRFLSNLDSNQKNDYIISMMKDIKNRNAIFTDVVCYINDKGEEYTFEGLNHGVISFKQSGNEGFGYDPLFYIPSQNKTEAELGNEYKCKYGHRAIAFRKFIEFFRNEK